MNYEEVWKLDITRVSTRDKITARGLAVALGFAGITAVSAQVGFYVPWTEVPITFQVFAVLLSGLVLGKKLGSIAQAQYLLMGLAGAPVFSNFAGGPAAFLRPSGGYLVGFMLGAYLTGWVWERSRSRSTTAAIAAGVVGTIAIYFAGVCWLSIYKVVYGQSMAWMAWVHGVLPFIGVDAVKIVAAAIVVTGHSPLAKKLRSFRVK